MASLRDYRMASLCDGLPGTCVPGYRMPSFRDYNAVSLCDYDAVSHRDYGWRRIETGQNVTNSVNSGNYSTFLANATLPTVVDLHGARSYS